MATVTYLTEEGLKKLREEIEMLETIERPRISRQIAEARDKGDLSENAEYDAAKEAQGMLEMRIAKLKDTLSNARLVDESKIDASKVAIHSTVTIQNTKNKAQMKYTIVAETEANLKEGKISVSSPIAKGLLGKETGEVAEVQTPSGPMEFKILTITR